MRKSAVLLVDGSGQPFPARVADAVLTWLPRLRVGFPTLDDTARVEVLEEAARRIIRRESGGHQLEHLHAYAWLAIRSVAISRCGLGRERLAHATTNGRHVNHVARNGFGATVAAVEARVLLRQVLDRLTRLERTIFTLKAAGFSTREIAKRLGRAPSTVDSIHSRAMARARSVAAGSCS